MDTDTADGAGRGLGRDGLDRLAAAFERRVQIDLRALAAFRIAMGSLIVFDILLRARDFTAFYTDRGVLPTDALYSDYAQVGSLHAWLGDAWLVAALFVLAAIFGVALALGYRTTTVTVVSWLLLFSLHNRNPMILNGGDVLFRLLLFWSIFLPLGERWSLDARRSDRDRSTVASLATVAVLAQIVLMYVSNFVHKSRGEDWLNGDAVPYIMTLDQFTVYLGPYLAGHTELLTAFTYVWLFLMALSPFLLLLTGWPRAILATAFMGMHLGMFSTMQIGIFPLVVVGGLLLFYPPVVWDTAVTLADRRGVTDGIAAARERLLRRWPTGLTRGSSGSLPTLPSVSAAAPSPGGDQFQAAISRGRSTYRSWILPGLGVMRSTVVPGVFIVLILVSNAHALGYTEPPPERGVELLDKTDTDQTWRLFAPHPLSHTRWFVANATLANGERVDAFTGDEVTFDRPPNAAERAGNARWRKYLSNVYSTDNENHRSYLANYLCERWNRSHDTEMERLELYALSQQGTPFGGESEVDRRQLITYDCSGSFLQS